MASNNSSQKTEVTHGEEKVGNIILQFLSKADRIDSCADHKAASLAVGVESFKKVLLDLKNRGVKTRYITEVTRGNIDFCKEMMKSLTRFVISTESRQTFLLAKQSMLLLQLPIKRKHNRYHGSSIAMLRTLWNTNNIYLRVFGIGQPLLIRK